MKLFKDIALQLYNSGLEPIPIQPNSKQPYDVKGDGSWANVSIDKEIVTKWSDNGYADYGVGLRCGTTIGIDVDIYDKDMSKRLADFMDKELNDGQPLIRRFGQAPKFLTPCTCAEITSKIQSTEFVDSKGNRCKIEVLAKGQQFVCSGIHSGTKKPYTWANGDVEDLSLFGLFDIALDDVLWLFDTFEEYAEEAGWKRYSDIKSLVKRQPTYVIGSDPFANVEGEKPSIEKLTDTIKRLPIELCDSYDDWRTVGMGIYHATSGSDEGFELFDDWSKLSDNYNTESYTRHKWTSFDSGEREFQELISYGTLCLLARPPAVDIEKEGIAVITMDDVQDTLSTPLTDNMIRPTKDGLIALGMDGLSAEGMPNIDQYSFPTVTASIANALAGKISCQGVWPNVYSVKVGTTSSGKSASDTEVKRAVEKVGLFSFFGLTDIASGAGLYRGMETNPQTMVAIDEITSLFRRYNQADAIADGKRDALLDIYSSSGNRIAKSYGAAKQSITIEKPCLTVTGNATPLIFDAITNEDFSSGLMQRFDFFCYDGIIPYRGIRAVENKKINMFAQGLKGIKESMSGGFGDPSVDGCFEIGLTANCKDLLMTISREVIDACNDKSALDGDKGIIARKYDLSIKYAMIHIGGTRSPYSIYDDMTVKDLKWGAAVATMLCDWKLQKLRGKVTTGDFHRDCETFKEAVLACSKIPQRPTFGLLAGRRSELKNWPTVKSKQIIEVLSKRGEIILDDSKGKTAYFIPK